MARTYFRGVRTCQRSRLTQPSVTLLPAPDWAIWIRPFGDTYNTVVSVATIEPRCKHGSCRLIFVSAMVAGLTPVTRYGVPAVQTTNDCPHTPMPTIGNSVVST